LPNRLSVCVPPCRKSVVHSLDQLLDSENSVELISTLCRPLQPWGNSFGLAGIAKLKTVCDSLIGIDSPVEAEDEVAQVIDAL